MRKIIFVILLLATPCWADDDNSTTIRDTDGLFIGSTRQQDNDDRTIVRDSYGRNIGAIREDDAIVDNWGRVQGYVSDDDDDD